MKEESTLYNLLQMKDGRTLYNLLQMKEGRTLYNLLQMKEGRTLYNLLQMKEGRTLYNFFNWDFFSAFSIRKISRAKVKLLKKYLIYERTVQLYVTLRISPNV